MKNAVAINLVKSEIEPEPMEIIAASIIRISDGFERLINSGLNERALCVLLKDMTGISMADISRVLTALPELKKQFTRLPAKDRKK